MRYGLYALSWALIVGGVLGHSRFYQYEINEPG